MRRHYNNNFPGYTIIPCTKMFGPTNVFCADMIHDECIVLSCSYSTVYRVIIDLIPPMHELLLHALIIPIIA